MRTWKPGGLSNGPKRLISVAAVVGALYTHQRLWGLGIVLVVVGVLYTHLISVAAVVGALYTRQRLWGLGIVVACVGVLFSQWRLRIEVFSAPVAVGAVGLCLLNSTDYGPFSLKNFILLEELGFFFL